MIFTETKLKGAFVLDIEPRCQVLEDNTETSYKIGGSYTPAVEGGLKYDDPRRFVDLPHS